MQVPGYTPFGEQLGKAVSGFGYNAEYYDAATGMQYLRARYYEPEMMRLSQQDLVRGSVVVPISLNRYLYVQNNPVLYSDPSGMVASAAIRSIAVSSAGGTKKAVATNTTSNVTSAAKVTTSVANTVRNNTTKVSKASNTIKNQGTVSAIASSVKTAAQQTKNKTLAPTSVKPNVSTNTTASTNTVRGLSSFGSCAGSEKLYSGKGGSFANKAMWGEGKLWYEKLLNGAGGFLYSFANNCLEGNIGPVLQLNDLLFGTSAYDGFYNWLSSVETNITINYVTNETYFYGGCLAGDVVDIFLGIVETGLGIVIFGSSITITAAGAAATATGFGSFIGIPAITVSIPAALAGAYAVVGGVSTICYATDNFGDHYSSFTENSVDNNYYKSGLVDIPDDWIEVEAPEQYSIKSESFIEFLESQGENPKKWRKVVEKWASPDGTIYQRHYWTNGNDYYYHGDGIEEYFPH